MINNAKPISMSEAQEFIGENSKEIKAFIKNFKPISVEKGKELRDKINELNLIKINEKHVSKLIDLMPEDKESLNKILSDVTLDEDETRNILETIKQYL